MKRKIICVLLCIMTVLTVFAGCDEQKKKFVEEWVSPELKSDELIKIYYGGGADDDLTKPFIEIIGHLRVKKVGEFEYKIVYNTSTISDTNAMQTIDTKTILIHLGEGDVLIIGRPQSYTLTALPYSFSVRRVWEIVG